MHRVLRRYQVVPEVKLFLDDQALNPRVQDAVSITGSFGANPGQLIYGNRVLNYDSWTETQIDLTWPDFPFSFVYLTVGYNIPNLLQVKAGGQEAARNVETRPLASDTYFQITGISGTGIFANDTNVSAGDYCLFRVDAGTLHAISTTGNIIVTAPFQGRYQVWDGSTWAGAHADVTR